MAVGQRKMDFIRKTFIITWNLFNDRFESSLKVYRGLYLYPGITKETQLLAWPDLMEWILDQNTNE